MSATVTQPIAVEQYRREFEEHIPLVYWIARKRLLHEDGSVPPDFDNAVANAVSIAWKHFPAIRERHADRPVRDAVCLAIRRGVGRVRHGEALGWSKPYRGYRDAMNGRPVQLADDAPILAPEPIPPEWCRRREEPGGVGIPGTCTTAESSREQRIEPEGPG